MHTVTLGGKQWLIAEPVFKDLKVILAALNRLNNPADSDANLLTDIQLILSSLIGDDYVTKFKRYRWQAWKLPPPSSDEIIAMLSAIPTLCGLQVATSSPSSTTTNANANDDWDALYWRVIRQTGWSWETVDTTMTMSRLSSLSESLNVTPSADAMIAAYLGYEYSKTDTLEDKIDAWLALTPTQH